MTSLVTITPDNLHLYLDDILIIECASFSSPWSSNAFEDEAGSDVSTFLALLLDGKTAAYVCFRMIHNEVQLVNLAVDPACRRMGLARCLLDRMVAFGLESEMSKVCLEVRPSNAPALELYDNFGFRRTGRRPGYYPDNLEDALVMTLTLDAARAVS